MKFLMRFRQSGMIGAAIFIGSIAISGFSYAAFLRDLSMGLPVGGLTGSPYFYVTLSIAMAIGLVMMIVGREMVEISSDAATSAGQEPLEVRPATPIWGMRS